MKNYEYAEVIIDISLNNLDRPFSYHIPEKLMGKLGIGTRVVVPFGQGNKPRKAYVVSLREDTDFDPTRVKDIIEVAADAVSMEEKQVELAAFIRKNYGGTMNQALKVVLPAKASVKQLTFRQIVRKMSREELISLKGEAIRKHRNAQLRLLDALLEQEEIPYEWVTGKLGVSGQTISSLEKLGALKINTTTEYRNPVHIQKTQEERHILSDGQQYIVDQVSADIDNGTPGKYLIHGITGSGKTEVYMGLIEKVVARGQQVIFLIPEIALTYQTLMRFFKRFGNRVSVLNSTLSPGEKYDQCMRAATGEIDIVIGPRSALFVPFPNLGMIVIDEEHEASYKSESTPKYHARTVAEHLAEESGAALVLGSATPSLEAYYRAKNGEYRLFELKERLTGGSLPVVSVVDLRDELKAGNRTIFSRRLQALIKDRLYKGEQSILFLNRRGYSGFISCRSCGEVIKCPHCDVSLSEHYGNKMQCHYCGYETVKPQLCPSCGGKYLAAFKAGTEQIEEKLKEMYPDVKVLRMDADTTKTKDSYEKILSAFANEEAQILIGTQMIVKGHDFPKVTLVGVLAADLSLNVSDYRASERTFQLLTQAVGRAGRGTLPGEAVIQTYKTDHYAVKLSAMQQYEEFYEEEIAYREMLGYPPAAHMLAIQVFGPLKEKAEQLAADLALVGRQDGKCVILGPTAGNVSKVKDLYRFVVYAKATEYSTLVELKDMLEERLKNNPPQKEYIQFDFDPINTL